MSSIRQRTLATARRFGLEPRLRTVQRALSRGASRRGYIDDEHTRLILAFGLREDACCVDVGASVGSVLADIVAYAPAGRHIAFEPIPEYARRLAERFPDVTVRNIALSDHSGTATFTHVVDAPGHSGLGDVDPGGGRVESFEVQVESLDESLPEGYVPDFIKIDVEGAELEVFRGMVSTLRTHRPIVVFEHGDHARRFGTRPEDIWSLLHDQAGLRVFDIDGGGPFASAAAFVERVQAGKMWTFVARA